MTKNSQPIQHNNKQQLQVFPYRLLRSSLFFALIWMLAAVGSLALIWRYHYNPKSQESLTLLIASFLSLVMALQSLDQYGRPYVYLYRDHMKIHYSLLRNINVCYDELFKINVVREDLELILKNGAPVILNLGHLSFQNQAALLKELDGILKGDSKIHEPSESFVTRQLNGPITK